MSLKRRAGDQVSLRVALNSGEYSDLLIRCGGREWKVHRVIVCNRCPFFQRTCKEGFIESKSGIIDLFDDEPEIFEIMLLYLYTLDYEVKISRNSGTAMITNACVYGLAHKYDIEGLQILAQKNFQNAIEVQWNHPRLAEAIQIVYDTTPASDRRLRDTLATIIGKHRVELLAKPAFLEILGTTDNFAADALKAVVNVGFVEFEQNQLHCDSCMGELASEYTPECSYCSKPVSHGFWMGGTVPDIADYDGQYIRVDCEDCGKNSPIQCTGCGQISTFSYS